QVPEPPAQERSVKTDPTKAKPVDSVEAVSTRDEVTVISPPVRGPKSVPPNPSVTNEINGLGNPSPLAPSKPPQISRKAFTLPLVESSPVPPPPSNPAAIAEFRQAVAELQNPDLEGSAEIRRAMEGFSGALRRLSRDQFAEARQEIEQGLGF